MVVSCLVGCFGFGLFWFWFVCLFVGLFAALPPWILKHQDGNGWKHRPAHVLKHTWGAPQKHRGTPTVGTQKEPPRQSTMHMMSVEPALGGFLC